MNRARAILTRVIDRLIAHGGTPVVEQPAPHVAQRQAWRRMVTASGDRILLDPAAVDFLTSSEAETILTQCRECGRHGARATHRPLCPDCRARQTELDPAA